MQQLERDAKNPVIFHTVGIFETAPDQDGFFGLIYFENVKGRCWKIKILCLEGTLLILIVIFYNCIIFKLIIHPSHTQMSTLDFPYPYLPRRGPPIGFSSQDSISGTALRLTGAWWQSFLSFLDQNFSSEAAVWIRIRNRWIRIHKFIITGTDPCYLLRKMLKIVSFLLMYFLFDHIYFSLGKKCPGRIRIRRNPYFIVVLSFRIWARWWTAARWVSPRCCAPWRRRRTARRRRLCPAPPPPPPPARGWAACSASSAGWSAIRLSQRLDSCR